MTALALVALVLAAEPTLDGQWKDGDRESVVQFTRAADGTWKGPVVSGKHATDVGKTVFPALTWDEKKAEWAGPMVKPDDDQKVNVTVKTKGPDRLEAVARVFIFSKTLTFTRVVEPK
jgi:hypothetical protein